MKKRILIVDHSPSARLALRRVLATCSELEVAGEASSTSYAVQAVRALRPELVTMDVQLGDEDGIAATRAIMAECPTPIVIVTGLNRSGLAFRATEAGALDVLSKPPLGDDERSQRARQRFITALLALSTVRLIGQHRPRSVTRESDAVPPPPRAQAFPPLIALGASTGGPSVLRGLLRALPHPFPGTIVIVQHIDAGFGASFASWLESTTEHEVKLVGSAELLRAGTAYVAPDQAHLQYTAGDAVRAVAGEPRRFQRPSIDVFFESIPPFRARTTLAVILTGMGDDGAAGLLRLRRHGALTMAQAPETCVVSAMPEAAITLGAVVRVLPLEQLARALVEFAARASLATELVT